MAPPVAQYTLVDTALSQVLAAMRVARRSETVPPHLSFGRAAAQDVVALSDVPPYPTSHWDGYAVISDDLAPARDSNPVSLKVVGLSRPGRRPKLAVRHQECVQVATGAPLPSGADAVVPVESVRVDGGLVRVTGPVTRGSHVYRPGDDVKKGQVLLRRGQTIRAQDVGLLVSLGFRRAKVWRKARVSIVATGSELTSPTRPKAGKVVNSHSPLFVSLLAELGCVPVDLGIAEDDTGRIARSIRHGLSRSDLVLTLGGTSAGRHDQVEQALAGLDPDLLIHGIKMDRGRVSGVSIVKGKPVLMLPGPIQGAMNALLLLGLPIIEAISGAQGRGTEVPCVFSRAWEARERYADFRKVVYVKRGGGPELTANPLDAETESMKLLAEADAYAVIPENVTRIEQGDKVMVRLLPGFSF